MVLGKLSVQVRPADLEVGHGPTVLAVGADGGCLSFLSSFSVRPPDTD